MTLVKKTHRSTITAFPWQICCCRRSRGLISSSICLLYITFAILYLNTFSLLLLSFCSLVLHTREQVRYSSILYLWYFVMLTSASHPRTESGFNRIATINSLACHSLFTRLLAQCLHNILPLLNPTNSVTYC